MNLAAGFIDGGGNASLLEKDNTFGPFWGANGETQYVIAPFASHTKTVRWGTYFKKLGCDLGTSGQVTCTGSYIGPLSNHHDLLVQLPPAFLEPPFIMAINGNLGVSTAVCGNKGAPTATSFTVVCSSGIAGANLKIYYNARGF